MGDIVDQKSLTNKHVILMILFFVSVTITATHFVTYNVIANNGNNSSLTEREKEEILDYVSQDKDKALFQQRIYLEQQAFNNKILDNIKGLNKELERLSKDYHKFKETGK